MDRFLALDIRWTDEREPIPLEYKGKKIYTDAPDKETALETFRLFADEMDISVTQIGTNPLIREPTSEYLRIEAPAPAGSDG